MHSVTIYFEARNRIAPGTGVYCVRQRSDVEFVKRVSALKAGDNTSVTWMRDVTVSVERDESTKSPNAIVQCVNDAQTSSNKVTESCRRRRSHEVFHNTPSCDVGQECINL